MRLLNVIVCSVAVGTMAWTAAAQAQPKQEGDKPRQPGGPQADRPQGDRPPPGDRQPGGPGAGGPGGGQQLAPEKAKAAWDLEAAGVSKRLGLNADQTTAVTKAYSEARESYNKASTKDRKSVV